MSEEEIYISTMPKLTGMDNHRFWARRSKNVLDLLELWPCIDPTDEETKDPGFARKDQRARNIIEMCVKYFILDYTEDSETAKQMWESLRTMFSLREFSAKHQLLQDLAETKLAAFSDIQKYVQRIMKLAQDLKQLDEEFPEWVITSSLLSGLGEPYGSFVSNIINSLRHVEEPDLDEVISQLLDEERRFTKNKPSTALLTSSSKDKKCLYCNGTGHVQETCWRLHPELKPKRKGDKAKRSGAKDQRPKKE